MNKRRTTAFSPNRNAARLALPTIATTIVLIGQPAAAGDEPFVYQLDDGDPDIAILFGTVSRYANEYRIVEGAETITSITWYLGDPDSFTSLPFPEQVEFYLFPDTNNDQIIDEERAVVAATFDIDPDNLDEQITFDIPDITLELDQTFWIVIRGEPSPAATPIEFRPVGSGPTGTYLISTSITGGNIITAITSTPLFVTLTDPETPIPSLVPIRANAKPAPDCLADLNNDTTVDALDLGLLLADFNAEGPNLSTDLNNDAIVDALDLGILLAEFAQICD